MPRSRAEWDEELAAEMLEDLEEITGISIGEMMADALVEAEEKPEFEVFPVFDEPTEDLPFDAEAPSGMDTDEYFDVLFDDLDIDADAEQDRYSED